MTKAPFWSWFDENAAPRLGIRADSFRAAFDYLDRLEGPVTIVETGSLREAGNWAGDGQSTLLFDKFASFRPGSVVHTIDLDPKAGAVSKSLVSPLVTVHTGDSVKLLRQLAARFLAEGRTIDLLYLDSYDLDLDNPTPSAVHHLKELVAAAQVIGPQTLVMTDDSAQIAHVVRYEGATQMLREPKIGGKGLFVAELAEQIGAKRLFANYQAGWTGLMLDRPAG